MTARGDFSPRAHFVGYHQIFPSVFASGVCNVFHLRVAFSCVVISLLLLGCSNPQLKELSKPTQEVTWPELKALQSPEVNMGIIMNAQRGDFAGVKKTASDPKFAELVQAFEESEIPSEFASPAREKAKTRVVSDYKTLVNSAKGVGSPQDIKAAVKSLQEGMSELTSADLK